MLTIMKPDSENGGYYAQNIHLNLNIYDTRHPVHNMGHT
jgi:hypothetical protein